MKTLLFFMLLPLFIYGCTMEGSIWLGDDVRASEKEFKNFSSKQIQRVEIINSNGFIKTDISNDDSIEVIFEKWVTGDDEYDAEDNLDNVKIYTEKDSSTRTLRLVVKYPIHFGGSYGCDVSISLPSSVSVDLKTSNGSIEVYGIENDIECQTSNGTIKIEDTKGDAILRTSNGKITVNNHYGEIDARTSNGYIDADVKLPKNGDCILRTSNDGITLSIPEDTSAMISASTSNNSVKISDLDVSVSHSEKSSLEGMIGDGKGNIELETSNGSILLKSRDTRRSS
jgi:hypothetical protein